MGAAPRRLFCLPSAGGGATAFMPLLTLDDETTEICPVALPAREHRFSEPLPKSMNNLADQMATELSPLLDRPYAILGYSMGALLGCELIRRWREAGCAEPEMFIALAARAPHLPLEDRPPLHHLEGDDFREALIELGGTPRELLDNREAMSLFEPILRGDLKNCETHA
ncbi:MAG: thioesterase domain-containing protein [Pseudomonadota bacterium]